MTPLIYFLNTFDARVNVTILDKYADKFITDKAPLYTVLANTQFIAEYGTSNAELRAISTVEGEYIVYIVVYND
jgi:hypothetical protein